MCCTLIYIILRWRVSWPTVWYQYILFRKAGCKCRNLLNAGISKEKWQRMKVLILQTEAHQIFSVVKCNIHLVYKLYVESCSKMTQVIQIEAQQTSNIAENEQMIRMVSTHLFVLLNDTRWRDVVKLLWCHSHLAIPTCTCFHFENLSVAFTV